MNGETNVEQIQIIDSNKHVGETVKIGAWIANKRSSGKIAFLQLRDGTAFFQGVVFKPNFIEAFGEEAGTEKFQEIKHLSQETAVMVTGVIKEDSRSKFGYEMDITDLEVVGASEDYPITPKEHGTDFLMDHRHLWLRSSKQHAIMLVRNEIIRATYEFFNEQGFIKIDSRHNADHQLRGRRSEGNHGKTDHKVGHAPAAGESRRAVGQQIGSGQYQSEAQQKEYNIHILPKLMQK